MSEILLTNLIGDTQDNKNLKPKSNNNVFNIIEDYPWTLSNNVKDVPYIELTEYEQDIVALYAQLKYWYTQAKDTLKFDDATNPYENLYHAKKTGLAFKLPYFSERHHNTQQNWGEIPSLIDKLEPYFKIATNIVSLATGGTAAVGMNINKPKRWGGGVCESYQVGFTLFNIKNAEDYIDNQKFINRLLLSSLHNQRNAILASPPALFTVKIPGIRYSPASVINSVNITNKGQMNYLNGMNIPDAYDVQLSITELILESRQILKGFIDNNENTVKALDFNEILNNQASTEIQGEVQRQNFINPQTSTPRSLQNINEAQVA